MRRYTVGFELGGPLQMHPLQAQPWPAYWDGLIDPGVDGSRFARVAGRAGGTAARVTSSGAAGGRTEVYAASRTPAVPAGVTVVHRFALRVDGLPSQSVGIARSGLPWSIYLRPDGRLVFFDGSPNGLDRTKLSTPPFYGVNPDAASLRNAWATVEPVVTPGTWAFVEVASLPPAQGFRYFIARVNGRVVVSQPRVAGAAAPATDELYVGPFEEGTGLDFAIAYDDLACNDATGPQQNGWPGAGRVVASFPDQDVYRDSSWDTGTKFSIARGPSTTVVGDGGNHHVPCADPPACCGGPPPQDFYGYTDWGVTKPFWDALNNVPPNAVDDNYGRRPGEGGDGMDSHQDSQITNGAADMYEPGVVTLSRHCIVDEGPPPVFLYEPGHIDWSWGYITYRITLAGDRLDVSAPFAPSGNVALAFMSVMSHGGDPILQQGPNFATFFSPELEAEPAPGEDGHIEFSRDGPGGPWPNGWTAHLGRTTYSPSPGRKTLRFVRKTDLRVSARAYSPGGGTPGLQEDTVIPGAAPWALSQAALVYEDQANPAAIVPPTGGFMAIV